MAPAPSDKTLSYGARVQGLNATTDAWQDVLNDGSGALLVNVIAGTVSTTIAGNITANITNVVTTQVSNTNPITTNVTNVVTVNVTGGVVNVSQASPLTVNLTSGFVTLSGVDVSGSAILTHISGTVITNVTNTSPLVVNVSQAANVPVNISAASPLTVNVTAGLISLSGIDISNCAILTHISGTVITNVTNTSPIVVNVSQGAAVPVNISAASPLTVNVTAGLITLSGVDVSGSAILTHISGTVITNVTNTSPIVVNVSQVANVPVNISAASPLTVNVTNNLNITNTVVVNNTQTVAFTVNVTAGTINVTAGIVNVTNTTGLIVIGAAADNATQAGNPVKIAGVYNSTTQSYGNTDQATLQMSVNGYVYTAVRDKVTTPTNIANVFTATSTTVTSAEIACDTFRKGSFSFMLDKASTPTDILFQLQFSDSSTNWYVYRHNFWADYRFDDTAVGTSGTDEVMYFEVAGRNLRLVATATGTDATNTFTITNPIIRLWD